MGTDSKFWGTLRAEAQSLGFVLLSSVNCCTPESYPKYVDWVRQGRHGDMAYLATQNSLNVRRDPAILLKGCRSILSLALPYCLPGKLPKIRSGEGRIAAFAQGLDYHQVVADLAEHVSHWLKTAFGSHISTMVAVDSKPILERDAAARGGMGWIGKNSCLISPQFGSCFFLAEILTDQEMYMPNGEMETDRCGDCKLCIEACPTGCILPDRTIDASRCNAYLTIEQKGSIPKTSRQAIGRWIFGCDICQMVCPWNKKTSDRLVLPQFLPQRDPVFPELTRELSVSNDEFQRKFRNSSILRIGRTRYLRNIAIALGNTRPINSLSALILCLNSEKDELIRVHAAWALGKWGSKTARDVLRSCLKTDSSALVKAEILESLQ